MFVSYSHKDYKAVYCDLIEFQRAGVRYWYDRGLPAGKDWNKVVEEKIKSPLCSGVVFYLSRNLFLSRSVLREIEYTMGEHQNGYTNKDYFCVNLAGVQPSIILIQIIQSYGQDELTMLGIDTNHISKIASAFKDEATYISKPREGYCDHIKTVVEQFTAQFDVVGDTRKPRHREEVTGGTAPVTKPRGTMSWPVFGGRNNAQPPNADVLRKKAMKKYKRHIPSSRWSDLYKELSYAPVGCLDTFMSLPIVSAGKIRLNSIFLGWLGLDRLLLRDYKFGIIKVALFIINIVLSGNLLATLGNIAQIVWWIADIFVLPKAAKQKNYEKLLDFLRTVNS